MKLILHIGQSKTGTTAIQDCLTRSRESLARAGILYPDYDQDGQPLHTPEHNAFAEELCGLTRYPRKTSTEYFEQFIKQMQRRKAHTMLLSAESFFGAPQVWRLSKGADFSQAYTEKLTRLKALISDFETTIIVYLRPPEDWLETTVPHIIRYDGLFKQDIYESDEQLCSLLQPHTNYPHLLSLWQSIIEPSNMCVRPYHALQLYKQDVVYDFCQLAHINPALLDYKPQEKRTHSSLDRRYIEVKKRLNAQPKTKTQERIIIECLNRLNRRLAKIEKYKLSQALNEKLQQIYAPIHIWLAEHYGENGGFFVEDTASNEQELPPISDVEIDKAMRDFQKLYHSGPMRFLYFTTAIKSYMRNNMIKPYAALKGVYKKLKQ